MLYHLSSKGHLAASERSNKLVHPGRNSVLGTRFPASAVRAKQYAPPVFFTECTNDAISSPQVLCACGFSVSDILFLGFGLDTEYYMCGLRGLMRTRKTANGIMKNWQTGVKDKIENKKLFAIPFTIKDVCEFVFSHGPWGGGALMGIYHTLVHEFGREAVERVLASFAGEF